MDKVSYIDVATDNPLVTSYSNLSHEIREVLRTTIYGPQGSLPFSLYLNWFLRIWVICILMTVMFQLSSHVQIKLLICNLSIQRVKYHHFLERVCSYHIFEELIPSLHSERVLSNVCLIDWQRSLEVKEIN